jgi:hypothetical protein
LPSRVPPAFVHFAGTRKITLIAVTRIDPYQNGLVDPVIRTTHFGQSIFECELLTAGAKHRCRPLVLIRINPRIIVLSIIALQASDCTF